MEKITFAHLPTRPTTKHHYEFQEVCSELEPVYGKQIWTIPHRKGITEKNMREAYAIANRRGIYTFAYFCGILKRLP